MKIQYNYTIRTTIDYAHYPELIDTEHTLEAYSNIITDGDIEYFIELHEQINKIKNKTSEIPKILTQKEVSNIFQNINNEIYNRNIDRLKKVTKSISDTGKIDELKNEKYSLDTEKEKLKKRIENIKEQNNVEGYNMDYSKLSKELDNLEYSIEEINKEIINTKKRIEGTLEENEIYDLLLANEEKFIIDREIKFSGPIFKNYSGSIMELINDVLNDKKINTLQDDLNTIEENKKVIKTFNDKIEEIKEKIKEDSKDIYNKNIEMIKSKVEDFYAIEKDNVDRMVKGHLENADSINEITSYNIEPSFEIDNYYEKIFLNMDILKSMYSQDGFHTYYISHSHPIPDRHQEPYSYKSPYLNRLIELVLGDSLMNKKIQREDEAKQIEQLTVAHSLNIRKAKEQKKKAVGIIDKIINGKLKDYFSLVRKKKEVETAKNKANIISKGIKEAKSIFKKIEDLF